MTIFSGEELLCKDKSLQIEGSHALLTGATEVVLGPLLRRAHVTAGAFLLGGHPIDQIDPATVGLVPLDPPLPQQQTPLEYVTWSARLTGHDIRTAHALAARCCTEVGLGAWASKPLDQLHVAYQRLTLLAQALISNPAFLILEAPLAGLDPQATEYVLQALTHASQGRTLLVTTTRESNSPLENLLGTPHWIGDTEERSVQSTEESFTSNEIQK